MVGRVRAIRKRLLLLVAAFPLLLAQSARAEVQSGMLVVGGGATEHDRTTISGAIERAVRDEGWSLPPKPPTKKEAPPSSSRPGFSVENSPPTEVSHHA